jgi:hypothetical protein
MPIPPSKVGDDDGLEGDNVGDDILLIVVGAVVAVDGASIVTGVANVGIGTPLPLIVLPLALREIVNDDGAPPANAADDNVDRASRPAILTFEFILLLLL